MERATISEVKNRLSSYLRRVREGKTVLILDRNQPVARLERYELGSYPDARLARIESKGIVQRAVRPIPFEVLRRNRAKPGKSVVLALLEERGEGR